MNFNNNKNDKLKKNTKINNYNEFKIMNRN